MANRIKVDFDKARINIEDGIVAESDSSDKEYFANQVKTVFDSVPSYLPYVDRIVSAVESHNFQTALNELDSFASYVENESGKSDSEEFVYDSSELDRVHDAYREHLE